MVKEKSAVEKPISVVTKKICGLKTNLAGHRDNLLAENQSRWSQRDNLQGEKPISLVKEKICGEKTNLFGLRYNLHGTTNLGGHRPGIGTENWLVTE